MSVTTTWTSGSSISALDGGGAIPSPFTARMADEELVVELAVEVRNGRPVCSRYVVELVADGDLALMTTDVMRGMPLRRLMAHACAQVALEASGQGFEVATSVEAIEAVLGSMKRRRAPVDDQRLREVADRYRTGYRPGGMADFAASIHCSERQAYRLIKLARDRGLLTKENG